MADKTGNKGEWSEPYALIKILADGSLQEADKQANPIPNKIIKALGAITPQAKGKYHVVFTINPTNQTISAETHNAATITKPIKDYQLIAQNLFTIIAKSKSTFSASAVEKFLASIHNPRTKGTSKEVSDISLTIHDPWSGPVTKGFSIKSDFNTSKPSLFNPSAATLFRYRLTHSSPITQMMLDKLMIKDWDKKAKKQIFICPKTKKKLGAIDRIQRLEQAGFTLHFNQVLNTTFAENLSIIDSNLPIILSHALYAYFSGKATSLIDVTNYLIALNPCNFPATSKRLQDFYQYKIKSFLRDKALGLQASQPWNGYQTVNGGFIIVKQTGNIVCFHIHNLNVLEDYLFENTKFEGPTSMGTGGKASFQYGFPIQQGKDYYIDLCLQIRFT